MKNRIMLVVMLFVLLNASSQKYTTAIGIKGDVSNLDIALAELSIKHFLSKKNAFEVNLGAGRDFLWAQVLFHRSSPLVKKIDWYWGTGADGGYWYNGNIIGKGANSRNGLWLGLDGVLGIEYTLNYIPINLAIDAGPTFRLIPEIKLGWMLGLSVRYGFR